MGHTIRLVIDGIEHVCVPLTDIGQIEEYLQKIKERSKEIEEKPITGSVEKKLMQFEKSMKEYQVEALVPIFYRCACRTYKRLTIDDYMKALTTSKEDTQIILNLAIRCDILVNGNNDSYMISVNEREYIKQLMKERNRT